MVMCNGMLMNEKYFSKMDKYYMNDKLLPRTKFVKPFNLFAVEENKLKFDRDNSWANSLD